MGHPLGLQRAVMASGNSLAGYLIPENVLAMRDAIRKYGAYPIRVS